MKLIITTGAREILERAVNAGHTAEDAIHSAAKGILETASRPPTEFLEVVTSITHQSLLATEFGNVVLLMVQDVKGGELQDVTVANAMTEQEASSQEDDSLRWSPFDENEDEL